MKAENCNVRLVLVGDDPTPAGVPTLAVMAAGANLADENWNLNGEGRRVPVLLRGEFNGIPYAYVDFHSGSSSEWMKSRLDRVYGEASGRKREAVLERMPETSPVFKDGAYNMILSFPGK